MEQKNANKIDGAIKIFLAVFMFVITLLTFYQVVMRYVFSNAPYWSEEVVRFIFVWVTLIGAAIGIKEKIHIGVDVLVNLFPPSLQRAANIFVYIVIAAFSLILIIYGWDVVKFTKNQPSPAVGIPMSYVYLALPVGGIAMVYYSIIGIKNTLTEKRVN